MLEMFATLNNTPLGVCSQFGSVSAIGYGYTGQHWLELTVIQHTRLAVVCG